MQCRVDIRVELACGEGDKIGRADARPVVIPLRSQAGRVAAVLESDDVLAWHHSGDGIAAVRARDREVVAMVVDIDTRVGGLASVILHYARDRSRRPKGGVYSRERPSGLDDHRALRGQVIGAHVSAAGRVECDLSLSGN